MCTQLAKLMRTSSFTRGSQFSVLLKAASGTAMMCMIVTASAEREQVQCNQAKYYYARLIAYESQSSDRVCGVFRQTVRHEVEVACKAKDW